MLYFIVKMMLFIIILLFILTLIFKLYMKFTTGMCKSHKCLVGKSALVTGANRGIGYTTALEFAKRGANVILACRNKVLAEEAKNKIIEETGNKNISVKIVDLSSLVSVREFALDVNDTVERLDILVNNAGAGGVGEKTTTDGNDLLMQINYLGPFLLTNLLIGLLKKSAPSRIVNLSSIAARFGKVDPKNINKKYPEAFNYDGQMYCNSKLCNILFTVELAKRLEGTQVTANSLHPGAVNTDIFRRMPSIAKAIFFPIFKFIFKTAEEGAQTTVHLSICKEVEDVSGKHFEDCKIKEHYSTVKGPQLAKEVFEGSMDLVKLTEKELQF